MPNPRVTVRVPQEIYDQLPTDERERSQLLKRLLEEYFHPVDPEDRITQLERRVGAMERRLGNG